MRRGSTQKELQEQISYKRADHNRKLSLDCIDESLYQLVGYIYDRGMCIFNVTMSKAE